MQLQGKTAVLTGAGSGIGRAIAISLAQRGCHLALADINEAGLAETAKLIPGGVRVSCHRLDVSDRNAVKALPDQVIAEHGEVDVLINNAGVAVGGTFADISETDFDWLLGINYWGVVYMTRAFLPLLGKEQAAWIANVSSIYGIIAPPSQTAYASSKFAVRGFTHALRHELKDTNIGVTVIHPGGVATQIVNSARIQGNFTPEQLAERRAFANRNLKMPPAQAGEIIVRGIERNKARIFVGRDAKFMSIVERIAPVSYWDFLSRLFVRS